MVRFILPLTPLHYPVAYLIYRLNKRLSLPGLIVGSMLPDIEVPIMLILFGTEVPPRLVLHSLLGAASLGTLFSLALTVLIYPTLVNVFFSIRLVEVEKECKLTLKLQFSCLLGNTSHVLLDYTNHDYNPIFWPFQMPEETPNLICSALGGREAASLIVQSILIIIGLIILLINGRRHAWKKLLLGG